MSNIYLRLIRSRRKKRAKFSACKLELISFFSPRLDEGDLLTFFVTIKVNKLQKITLRQDYCHNMLRISDCKVLKNFKVGKGGITLSTLLNERNIYHLTILKEHIKEESSPIIFYCLDRTSSSSASHRPP